MLITSQVSPRNDGKEVAEVILRSLEIEVHHHIVVIGQLYPTVSLQAQHIQYQVVFFEGVFALVLVYLKHGVQTCRSIVQVTDAAVRDGQRINFGLGIQIINHRGQVSGAAMVDAFGGNISPYTSIVINQGAIIDAVIFQVNLEIGGSCTGIVAGFGHVVVGRPFFGDQYMNDGFIHND